VRRKDGRGVCADADERRLAERRLSRHAGQQHEAERHHAVEPDVVAERHPELRREERDADEDGSEDGITKLIRHLRAYSSSS
jgi:hypothetical protein